jgi:cyanophycin synthetase
MTSTDGVVDERLLIRSDASGPRSARIVLQNPHVDFAAFEVARGGILREGLGYERNDVGVVLNVQPDHLGLRGIDTLKQLADVKAVVVEAVPRNGFAVLNADGELVRAMRLRCAGRIVWFTMAEPGSEIRDSVDDHCRRGGRAVVLEHSDLGDMIMIKEGRRSMQLAWTQQLAVLVSHDRNDVAVARTGDLHPGVGSSLLDQLAKLVHAASPQVPRLVGDLDKIRA